MHCITNYVAATDSANALLAVGATPVMADCPYECGDITRRSRTLLLNMGTFSEGHYEAFKSSAEAALEIGIPFVLDPVGLSASGYRQKCFQEIVASRCPSVIKCNLSEAYTVACLAKVKAESPLEMCQKIACKLNSAVMITGSDDYISDGINSCILHGGTAKLTKVTGTGCVTGALTAAFLSAADGVYNGGGAHEDLRRDRGREKRKWSANLPHKAVRRAFGSRRERDTQMYRDRKCEINVKNGY